MFSVRRLLIFPLNINTAKRHYRYHDITASCLPSPPYHREIFSVSAVITVITAVLPLSSLPCHPLLWSRRAIEFTILAGRADVQDSADVIPAISEPAHLVAHQRTQHSIVVRPTSVRAISTDVVRHSIVQRCRTPDLELTATCCVKLRLSATSNPCFIGPLLSANYSVCSASASIAA